VLFQQRSKAAGKFSNGGQCLLAHTENVVVMGQWDNQSMAR